MFAFAIWDERRRELMLARDRVGKKPLFFRATDNAFWFALRAAGDPRRTRSVPRQAWIRRAIDTLSALSSTCLTPRTRVRRGCESCRRLIVLRLRAVASPRISPVLDALEYGRRCESVLDAARRPSWCASRCWRRRGCGCAQ